LYPVTPTLSVEALQETLICELEATVAAKPVGTEGGVVSELLLTVSVAAALVTVPAVLLTTTRNVAPLSAVVVTGVV
jgi:hypothetical protein